MTKKEKAKHFDEGKPDLSLIPYAAEVVMAQAFTYGAQKYGRYNYCKGHNLSQLIASARRHLSKFYGGEDVDDESGVHHLGHALVNLAMILHQKELGTLIDDRYKKEKQEPEMALMVDERTGQVDSVPYYSHSDAALYTMVKNK